MISVIIDTRNYQRKISVKIKSYEHCKHPDESIDEYAYWISFQVIELVDIRWKDFMKVHRIQNEASRNKLEKMKKFKDMGTLLTGYVTEEYGDGIYYLYIPELNLYTCNNPFDAIVCHEVLRL